MLVCSCSESAVPSVYRADDNGACCSIYEGGERMCVVDGLDPRGGLGPCVEECRTQWTNEQYCSSQVAFVIECVDANQSCTALDVATCGDFPSAALRGLYDCLE